MSVLEVLKMHYRYTGIQFGCRWSSGRTEIATSFEIFPNTVNLFQFYIKYESLCTPDVFK